MKLGIFSDIHIHNYKKFNKENKRLWNCIKALHQVVNECYDKGIRYILFAGDLYNTPKGLPPVVVNVIIEAFKSIFKDYPDLKFIAISGNHDQPNNNLLGSVGNTALLHLEDVFNNFILLDYKTYQIKKHKINIVGIPYYQYPEDYNNVLERLADQDCYEDAINILLIHQTPTGISNTNIPADFNPENKIYKKFDMVFCGHIHKHEKLTDNVIVVGSPIHRDLSDVGEKKGYLIYDTETKKCKFKRLKGFPEFSRNIVQESEQDFNVPNTIVLPKAIKANTEVAKKFSITIKKKKLLKNYLEYMKVDNQEELLKVGKQYV